MGARGSQRREGAVPLRPLRAAAAALLVSAPGWGSAGDLDGRAVLGWQGNDQDERQTRFFHQAYDLSFQQPVSTALQYRLALRYQDDQGSNVDPGRATDVSTVRSLRPSGELRYHLAPVDLGTEYDLVYSQAHASSGGASDRKLERVRATLVVHPPDLPSFALQGERYAIRDVLTGADQALNGVRQSVQYERTGLALGQTARYERYDDFAALFQRNVAEGSGRVGWSGLLPFLREGRLALSNQLTVTRYDEISRSAVPISVATPVTGGAGLYSLDQNPGTSPGVPMSSVPALTDGLLSASTGISLTAESFQNVGVDMGRFVAVDVLRIYVRNAAGDPVPSGGSVDFTAYTSADGITWFPSATTVVFNVPGSYFEVQFVRVTARFFKAVSFGMNTTETLVTEVQPLATEGFSPDEQRATSSWLDSAQLEFSASPVRSVTVRYTGLANLGRTRAQGDWTSHHDLDQIAAVSWRALAPLRLEASYQRRELTTTSGPGQSTDIVTGTVEATPRPELQQVLTLSRTNDNVLAHVSYTNQATLTNRFVFYRTLDLNLTLGFARQLWPDDYVRIDRWYVNALSLAHLTPSLTGTLSAQVQRSDGITPLLVAGGAGLTLPVARDEQYYGELNYHPNPQLMLGLRLGYTAGARVSGFIQRYRVYWDPFPGGAIQIGGSVDEEVDASTDTRLFRLAGTFRWNVNLHTYFDGVYNRMRIHNHIDAWNENFVLNLTLKL